MSQEETKKKTDGVGKIYICKGVGSEPGGDKK